MLDLIVSPHSHMAAFVVVSSMGCQENIQVHFVEDLFPLLVHIHRGFLLAACALCLHRGPVSRHRES